MGRKFGGVVGTGDYGYVNPWKQKLARKMAKHMTRPEAAMWEVLKDGIGGAHFVRQKVIFGYIADYFCSRSKLVVEVDGPLHCKQKAYDNQRDKVMEDAGLKVLRFSDHAVYTSMSAVKACIAKVVKERLDVKNEE